ncbi:MAG: hypothetical protein HOO96_41610 [Polyangiaceae bacterium]|nr:hypothetical protein [Polyangiaceae bacterium]
MLKRRIAVAGVAALLGLVAATAAPRAQADLKITPCHDVGSNTVQCRIDEPIVNASDHVYGAVQLRPGDKVTVAAGGCVQTGGRGRTWKRYVDPSGPNSDHRYFGLLGVPMTGIQMRVRDAMKSGFTVPKQCGAGGSGPQCLVRSADPAELFLSLGYADDDFGDNGYYSHDDGTEDQCRGSQNAWVELTIRHDPTVVWPPLPVHGNGIEDGDETDVDCGGASAPACADGKQCSGPRDCKAGVCASDAPGGKGRCLPALPCAPTDVCRWDVGVTTCNIVLPDGQGGCQGIDPGRAVDGISTPPGSTARVIRRNRAITDANGSLTLTLEACRSKADYQVVAAGYHTVRAPNPDLPCNPSYRIMGRDTPGKPIAPPPPRGPRGPNGKVPAKLGE